jgi:uncharacterized membrane protein HdeD (DUF308 family)
MVNTLARNWWALAIRGLVAVLFGIVALIWPGITLTALVYLFGAYALVDGVFSIIAAVRDREEREQWWVLLLEGLAGIAAGIVAFIWPGITALVLLFLIAAWAIITGILEIVAAIRLREQIDNEWLLALSGVLSLIFGAILVIAPGPGALAVVWIIGIYAILFGILLILLAFRARGWAQEARPGM